MKKLLFGLIGLFVVTGAYAAVHTAVCASCHGKNFEKSALGKSKIVANMSHEDVVKALLGYKKGTYGGSMKVVMAGQVAKYSVAELKIVNVGKSTDSKLTSTNVKKSVKHVKAVSHKGNIYVYREKDMCCSVDYKKQQFTIVDCDISK